MRTLTFLLLASLGGTALASELDQANAAYAARQYPKALSLYQKLADQGDPQAQVRLGEMVWYGEGVAADRSRADALFAKAAAAGNAQARADLQLSPARALKATEIAYWTSRYQGEDLVTGKFACPAPALPSTAAMDRTGIEKVGATFEGWRQCYEGFITNLGDAMPAGKRIPAEASLVMSDAELQQAKAHLSAVYAQVLQQKKDEAAPIVAQLDDWTMRTAKFNVDRKAVGEDIEHWMKYYRPEKGTLGHTRVSMAAIKK